MDYQEFLSTKRLVFQATGKRVDPADVHPMLFPFQRDLVVWAARKGRAAIFADTGLGKALTMATPVLTPAGQQPIGSICVGDQVIGSNGRATTVIGVFPQGLREAYEVTFSDGTVIECDKDHLWAVRTKVQKYRKQDYHVMTTQEILDSGLKSQEGWKWFIPMVEPIEFEPRDLPLDPYLLGALIGDGSLSTGTPSISSADEEILEQVALRLPAGVQLKHVSSYDWALTQGRRNGHSKNPLTEILKALGLYGNRSGDKFIPSDYIYTDIESRVLLLQGLMDTDGYAAHDGNVNYCTVSPQLAEDVALLVQTLGGKAPIRTKKTSGQLAYQMSISLPNEIVPFMLSRKREIWRPRVKYFPVRAIVAIEPTYPSEMVCIAVDAPDSLYVAAHCIVTHNTFMQLEWARLVGERALIVAPLSVARQTVGEGLKIGLEVHYTRSGDDLIEGLNITNYEMIDHFNADDFGAVVLDESSILKSLNGKTRQKLTDMFAGTQYKLACTATPAPNDIAEIANHAEFLGIMSRVEMLAAFFVHDDEGWRLKKHAENGFFRWMASWGMSIKKPSNLGYDDDGFMLPLLIVKPRFIDSGYTPEGQLFFTGLHGISDRANVRRKTMEPKAREIIEIILKSICDNLEVDVQYSGKLSDTERYNGQEEIQRRVLRNKQGTGTPAGTRVLSSKQRQGRSREKTRVQPPMESGEQRSGSGIQESEQGQTQRSTQRALCTERANEDNRAGTGAPMASKQPGQAKGTAPKEVQFNDRGVSVHSRKTEWTLRYMRLFRSERSKFLSLSRSFARNGKGKGSAVYKLQSSTGEIKGRSGASNGSDQIFNNQWVIWCGLNDEQDLMCDLLTENGISHTSVYGSLSPEEKIVRIEDWQDGKYQVIVSKISIMGFGLNLQNAHYMAFVGLNDSWEGYYQAVRREWRLGQTQPVTVHVVLADVEQEIWQNVREKEKEAGRMSDNLIKNIQQFEKEEIEGANDGQFVYDTNEASGDGWRLLLGDSVERMKELTDNSMDLSVFSPPFQSLYTYSPTERDLGNSRDKGEFFSHFGFIIDELLRITKPGRLAAVHVQQLTATLQNDGFIGMKDFRGDVIRAFSEHGWIYNGEVCIDKDPQAQAIRTHSKGLLFVQLRKDSVWSRPALADYIVIFRKPGENAVPVHTDIDNETWIEWARPIWYGIKESDTLNFTAARADRDERHICPLQLGTIERCIRLWTNQGEVVFDPFSGIASTGFESIRQNRQFVGIELKPEYFNQGVKNLSEAQRLTTQVDLFQWAESNKQPEAVPEDIDVYLNDLTNAMRDEGS